VGHAEQVLTERLAVLSRRIGPQWTMYPVHWGDLGSVATREMVRATLPTNRLHRHEVRGSLDPLSPDGDITALATALATGATDSHEQAVEPLADKARLAAVAVGVERELARRGPSDDLAEDIVDAVAAEWSDEDVYWLWQANDLDLLAEVGVAIADGVVTAMAADEEEVRVGKVQEYVRDRLPVVDRLVGAALGSTVGRVYDLIRTVIAEQIADTFGDVITYQRRQQEIHDRVRQVIRTVDPELGTREHPVHLAGHSLGATIALDLATIPPDATPGPVWTKSVLTFGSLWPVFHLCDPRSPALRPYTGEQAVRLPESVGRWTNLWEPLDPFAFLAANVFTLADGTAPNDVRVQPHYSGGLQTHSVYWESRQLVDEMVKTFTQE